MTDYAYTNKPTAYLHISTELTIWFANWEMCNTRSVNCAVTNNCRLADRAVYRAHLQPALRVINIVFSCQPDETFHRTDICASCHLSRSAQVDQSVGLIQYGFRTGPVYCYYCLWRSEINTYGDSDVISLYHICASCFPARIHTYVHTYIHTNLYSVKIVERIWDAGTGWLGGKSGLEEARL